MQRENQSKLNKLIQELCPNGVEYRTLGEIAHYVSQRIDRSKIDNHTYVGVENLLQNKGGKVDSLYVPDVKNFIYFKKNDVLIGNIRPYLKKIWLAEYDGGSSPDVLAIRLSTPKLAPDFLFYCLSSDSFFAHDMQFAKGAKMPRGDKEAIMQFPIPVPPLPVQSEIVRILDAFTALTAELTAELTARRKQYEYYRDRLLKFDDLTGGIRWVELSEVAKGISSGKNKEKLEGGSFPVYGSTGIIAYTETAVYDEPRILVARVGANAGYVHIADGMYDVSDNTLIIDLKMDKALLRYVYHVLTNMNINQYAKGGGQPLITASLLKDLPIPLPPLSEQRRIVSILDRFDALCNDLTQGLPAEIAARRKQYEFYRDRLLDFQRKE